MLKRKELAVGKTYVAASTDGALVVGVRQVIKATASVGAFERTTEGLELEFTGDSLVDWDSQTSARVQDDRLFVDDNGTEWAESELLFFESDKASAQLPVEFVKFKELQNEARQKAYDCAAR